MIILMQECLTHGRIFIIRDLKKLFENSIILSHKK